MGTCGFSPGREILGKVDFLMHFMSCAWFIQLPKHPLHSGTPESQSSGLTGCMLPAGREHLLFIFDSSSVNT